MPFTNPIVGGGGGLIRDSIKSPDFQSGVSGWQIRRDGSAEFNDVTIRGTVESSNFADHGSAGTTGWRLAQAGDIQAERIVVNTVDGNGTPNIVNLSDANSRQARMQKLAGTGGLIDGPLTTTTSYQDLAEIVYFANRGEQSYGWLFQTWRVRAMLYVTSSAVNNGNFLARLVWNDGSGAGNTTETIGVPLLIKGAGELVCGVQEWICRSVVTTWPNPNPPFFRLQARHFGTVPYDVNGNHSQFFAEPIN